MLVALLLAGSFGLFSAGIASTLESLFVLRIITGTGAGVQSRIRISIYHTVSSDCDFHRYLLVRLFVVTERNDGESVSNSGACNRTWLGLRTRAVEAIAEPILDGFAIGLDWPPLVIVSGAALFPVFAGFAQSCSCG